MTAHVLFERSVRDRLADALIAAGFVTGDDEEDVC